MEEKHVIVTAVFWNETTFEQMKRRTKIFRLKWQQLEEIFKWAILQTPAGMTLHHIEMTLEDDEIKPIPDADGEQS